MLHKKSVADVFHDFYAGKKWQQLFSQNQFHGKMHCHKYKQLSFFRILLRLLSSVQLLRHWKVLTHYKTISDHTIKISLATDRSSLPWRCYESTLVFRKKLTKALPTWLSCWPFFKELFSVSRFTSLEMPGVSMTCRRICQSSAPNRETKKIDYSNWPRLRTVFSCFNFRTWDRVRRFVCHRRAFQSNGKNVGAQKRYTERTIQRSNWIEICAPNFCKISLDVARCGAVNGAKW